jgi:hypothetical protein
MAIRGRLVRHGTLESEADMTQSEGERTAPAIAESVINSLVAEPPTAKKAMRANPPAALDGLGPLPWEDGWNPMKPYNGPKPEWAD